MTATAWGSAPGSARTRGTRSARSSPPASCTGPQPRRWISHASRSSGLEEPACSRHLPVAALAAGDQDLAIVQQRRAEIAEVWEPGRDHLERPAVRLERLDGTNGGALRVHPAE